MTAARCGTVAPLRRCGGPVGRNTEWTNPRGYIVPRDMRVTLPAGFTFAGSVLTVAVAPRSAPVCLDGNEWGPEVAPLIRMLLLVPAVASEVMVEPGAGSRAFGDLERLKVRRPVRKLFTAGDRLTLQAVSSRSGEVAVVPLKLAEAR